MIPKFADPGYIDGDDFGPLEPQRWSYVRALSSAAFQRTPPLSLSLDVHAQLNYHTLNYTNFRYVCPHEGSAVVFTHRIIHWGSAGRNGYGGDERLLSRLRHLMNLRGTFIS